MEKQMSEGGFYVAHVDKPNKVLVLKAAQGGRISIETQNIMGIGEGVMQARPSKLSTLDGQGPGGLQIVRERRDDLVIVITNGGENVVVLADFNDLFREIYGIDLEPSPEPEA